MRGDQHNAADEGRPDEELVRPGGSKNYTFPLMDAGRPERAAFAFYHDHRMDVTGRNNWYGLQGMFITDDPAEKKFNLPVGKYDVPLMIADRTFDDAAQLTDPFPKESDPHPATEGINGPYAPPGDATVGNRTLVNGGFQPFHNVATHRYRPRPLTAAGPSSDDFRFAAGPPQGQVGHARRRVPQPARGTGTAARAAARPGRRGARGVGAGRACVGW